MFDFVIFVLGSVGMSHILVDGSIFEGLRNWTKRKVPFIGEILGCYLCSGMYTAMFCSIFILNNFLSTSPTWIEYIAKVFICGCAGSFLSMAAAVILIRLNRNDND